MAARTVEELLREYLGGQTLTMLQLQAEVERLRALDEMHQQERAAADAAKTPTNGREPVAPPEAPRAWREPAPTPPPVRRERPS